MLGSREPMTFPFYSEGAKVGEVVMVLLIEEYLLLGIQLVNLIHSLFLSPLGSRPA
jgi:hypothetical protein